jgi:hypothetical protein
MDAGVGHQLDYVRQVFAARKRSAGLAPEATANLAQQYSRVIMQIVVTLALLTICAMLLLQPNQSETLQKAATGFIGAIIGYWLR